MADYGARTSLTFEQQIDGTLEVFDGDLYQYAPNLRKPSTLSDDELRKMRNAISKVLLDRAHTRRMFKASLDRRLA